MNEQEAHDILLAHNGKPTFEMEPKVREAIEYLISIDKFNYVLFQILLELAHQDLVRKEIVHDCEKGELK